MLTDCLWLQTTVAGRTFLSVQHEGAVVLDWCYDTMDNATKMDFVSGLKKVANMDAPGYPIVRAQHTHKTVRVLLLIPGIRYTGGPFKSINFKSGPATEFKESPIIP